MISLKGLEEIDERAKVKVLVCIMRENSLERPIFLELSTNGILPTGCRFYLYRFFFFFFLSFSLSPTNTITSFSLGVEVLNLRDRTMQPWLLSYTLHLLFSFMSPVPPS